MAVSQNSKSEGVTTDEDNSLLEEGIVNVNTLPAKSKTDELVQTLEKARGKRLLICIKGYPDPDNIATSLALSYMSNQFEIQSTIVHFEQISHHENRALVKKLDLDIEEYSDQFDYSGYDYFAINDSQNTELPIKLPETCELLVFVDHHKRLGTVKGHFVDIRESVGSTSAIYGEYLRDSRFNFTGDSFEESKIATALMHGVRSDTDNFVNATPLDYSASEFLSRYVDKDLLSLISRQSISSQNYGSYADRSPKKRHKRYFYVFRRGLRSRGG